MSQRQKLRGRCLHLRGRQQSSDPAQRCNVMAKDVTDRRLEGLSWLPLVQALPSPGLALAPRLALPRLRPLPVWQPWPVYCMPRLQTCMHVVLGWDELWIYGRSCQGPFADTEPSAC